MGIRQTIANLIQGKSHEGRYGLFNSVDGLTFDKKSSFDFLRYNEISLYANKAIDKRAEKVGEVEFVLRKGEDIIDRHPLLDLLNRPNKFHTGAKFWKLYQKYYDLTGRAFIFIESGRKPFQAKAVPTALHLLRPDMVTVKFNEQGTDIEKFIYHKPSGGEIAYEPEDIIYSFNPDPMSPVNGASLLLAGIRAMETEIQLSEYHAKVLKNGGKVEGVFNFETGELTKQQLTELKERYDEQFAEAKQAGKPLFLGGGAKYERLGLNPEELSYLEAKGVTLDDICILTGVPRPVLANVTDVKFDNADAAHAMFLRETIKPLLRDLTTTLDWRFIPEELDLDFVDPTPENVKEKMDVLRAAHETQTLTLNERREMLGQEPLPIPEADKIFIPFSLVPLEGAADPKPEEKPKDEPEDSKQKGFEHPLRDEFIRKRYGELMVKRMDRQEERFLKAAQTYFNEQQKRLISPLSDVRTYRRKGLIDELFDLSVEVKIAQETFLPLLEEMLKEAGDDVMAFVEAGRDFVLSSEIRTWLDERSHLLANQITDTTFEKLKDQFSESLEAGENRQDLIKRIEGTYDGFTQVRARTIARTEVHGSVQKGTFEGYKQARLPIKIWVTVGDARVRDSHGSIDGEERPVDMPFSNGLQYPGDPSAPAGEVINCRCTI